MLDTPDRIVSGPCPLVFSLVAAEADVLASTDFETADDGLRSSAAFTFRYDAPDTALLGVWVLRQRMALRKEQT